MLSVLLSMSMATPPLIPPDNREAEQALCPPFSRGMPFPASGDRKVDTGDDPHDALGDVWEMSEISCWRGIWMRRGKSDIFDGYFLHSSGERQRVTLRISIDGSAVSITRRHRGDRYCHYDGVLGADRVTVQGTYTCDWAKQAMNWRGHIVRF